MRYLADYDLECLDACVESSVDLIFSFFLREHIHPLLHFLKRLASQVRAQKYMHPFVFNRLHLVPLLQEDLLVLGCEIVDLRSHEYHPHYIHEENSRVVQNAHQERSR